MRSPHLRPSSGFTLVELLVVIAIVVVLAGILLIAITKGQTASKTATTKMIMDNVASSISSLYWEDIDRTLKDFNGGSLPTTYAPSGITGNAKDLGTYDVSGWEGSTKYDRAVGFLRSKGILQSDQELLDAWERPLYLRIDLTRGAIQFWSLGEDGEDDNGKGPASSEHLGLKDTSDAQYDDIVHQVDL